MGTLQFRRGLIIFMLLGIAAGICWVMPKPLTLQIADAYSGTIYGQWNLEEGELFEIEFVHSVNNSPVRDSFAFTRGEIRPVASRFSGFGAGIQSDLEEGQTLSRDGEYLVITGYKTTYKELLYIVGTVSDHILFIQGEQVSLRDLCGKNAHIKIQAVSRE